MERTKKKVTEDASPLGSINEDLAQKILERLPAASFASAACVSKSWNRICNRVLFSRPKLASALSLYPSHAPSALGEVVEKVLSEPIRPDFALAHVSGFHCDLGKTLDFFGEKLGRRTPIIVTWANGIVGRNVSTDEHLEFNGGDACGINEKESRDENSGVVLTVGFLPGLRVGVIPLLRPKRASKNAKVQQFVTDIKNFSACASGSTSPAVIMLFGERTVEQKSIVEELDNSMSEETVIIGDERTQFVYRSGMESENVCRLAKCTSDAVALVLARDRNKPCGIGEIHFHAEFSRGLSAMGPIYKAVSVRVSGSDRITRLTARRDGQQEILDGDTIISEINDELENHTGCPELYIGITRQRKCLIGPEKSRLSTFMAFHGLLEGNEECLVVDGIGIHTRDYFQFYRSDPNIALSSCTDISAKIRNLKLEWNSKNSFGAIANDVSMELIGGFVFACCGRGESFFGRSNVDSSPFLANFPGAPLAGIFCCGEIGRGLSTGYPGHCCLHVYSTVYLGLSYVPASVTR